jgi:ferredoxin
MTKIFYFTGTGNTLKLAQDLAAQLPNTQLVRIRYNMELDHSDCETVGIASPVYCFGQPNIVEHFLKNVQLSKTAYIFSLSSYGGLLTSSGRRIRKHLSQRGYTLNAGFAIRMPGNATTLYNVPPAEKRESMYATQQQRIPQIAEMVKNKQTYGIDTNLGFLGRIASTATGVMMNKINESDKSFFTDDNCNGCGICAKICPVGNITMSDNTPQWQHRCECCMACFHWCPQASIQGSEKTKSRDRYHHPDIRLEQMLA